MTSLPDELIAAVVDELEHDRESLKACSLVGASFCAPSQRRLFHSMWLHHDAWWFSSRSYTPSYSGERGTPGSTIRTLAPVLSESPHLATYVRRLTIDLTTFPEEAALLAQMLRAMQNLKTFAVSSSFLNWNDLPLALTSACLDVLELPSLDRLHLWCIENIPASVILGALSSTTVLSIFSSTIATQLELPTSAAEPVPENTSRLHKLLLTSSESSSYDLILSPRAPELTQMTTLLLRPHIATKLGAERLLSSLSGTLTHLILDSEQMGAPYLINFPTLPKLRFVTLRLFHGLRKRYIPEGFVGTLTALPRASLTIVFSLVGHSTEEPWPDENPLPGLEEWQMEGSIRCQLRFMNRPEPSLKEAYFEAFGVAMRAALPGRRLDIYTADKEEWHDG